MATYGAQTRRRSAARACGDVEAAGLRESQSERLGDRPCARALVDVTDRHSRVERHRVDVARRAPRWLRVAVAHDRRAVTSTDDLALAVTRAARGATSRLPRGVRVI